jgi:hypothetical protein
MPEKIEPIVADRGAIPRELRDGAGIVRIPDTMVTWDEPTP